MSRATPPADRTEQSDRDLLAAHCAGDPEAFAEIFRRHRDRMWAVAVRTTRNPDTAADAVQDAFVAAFRRADTFRGESAVTTWLHRIVVNACLDRLRRQRPTAELGDDSESFLADPTDAAHRVEVRLDVQQALARLPLGQRLALVLVDMHGLSVAEAADVLDVAEGTVKSRCARGRQALALLLNPDGSARPAPSGPGSPGSPGSHGAAVTRPPATGPPATGPPPEPAEPSAPT